jgi:hypothetical protein
MMAYLGHELLPVQPHLDRLGLIQHLSVGIP